MSEQDQLSFLAGLEEHLLIHRQKALESFKIYLLNAPSRDGWDVVQATIGEKLLALCGSDGKWESRHGGFLGAAMFLPHANASFHDELLSSARANLEHPEARVRLAVAETLEALSKADGAKIYEAVKDELLSSIYTNFDRTATEKATTDDMGDVAAAQDRSSLFRDKPKKNPELAQIRHDTEGWRSLETSFSALQKIMGGLKGDFVPYLNEEILSLIYRSVNHTNRFVRETGECLCCCYILPLLLLFVDADLFIYLFIFFILSKSLTTFITFLFEGYFACGVISEIAGHEKLNEIGDSLTAILATGLSDNWSQVRYGTLRCRLWLV